MNGAAMRPPAGQQPAEATEALTDVISLADAATPGPWRRSDFGLPGDEEPTSIVVHTGPFDWPDLRDPDGESAIAWFGPEQDDDSRLIAASRTIMPLLAQTLLDVLDLGDTYGQAPDRTLGWEGYRDAVQSLIEQRTEQIGRL